MTNTLGRLKHPVLLGPSKNRPYIRKYLTSVNLPSGLQCTPISCARIVNLCGIDCTLTSFIPICLVEDILWVQTLGVDSIYPCPPMLWECNDFYLLPNIFVTQSTVRKVKTRLCDPPSWLLLAAGASSRNLFLTF